MAANILSSLRDMREDLLRQLVLTSGSEKAEILTKIIEIEQLIADEEKTR
ncbi:MAG: hypothetical protein ACOX6X_00475 [Dethiobacteria bacterium]|jgi:hypothetical protein